MITDNPHQAVLKKRRAQPFHFRHPWVFSNSLSEIIGSPKLGDVVDLVTHSGDFVARGLFNPNSQICLRLYSWRRDVASDLPFWQEKIHNAIALRTQLGYLGGDQSACRLVSSEGDGISGLTVDRYGRWLVVQFTSAALAIHTDEIVDYLMQAIEPHGIILRTEKGIRDAEGLELTDGVIRGEAPSDVIQICENELDFLVDLHTGQKTGFYLDQRVNQLVAAQYMGGREVLDLFCYSGGFGLSALKHGDAQSVYGIDVSSSAIELAKTNARNNQLESATRYEAASAFPALEAIIESGKRYDAVYLDPPKMARKRRSVDQALKGYFSLNRLAVESLNPGGILVTCSCSGLVGRDEFLRMLGSVATRADRDLQVLDVRGAAPDHPVSVACPESDYLQCVICRLS